MFDGLQIFSNTTKYDQTWSNSTTQGGQKIKCLVTKQCLMVFGRQTFPVWTGLKAFSRDEGQQMFYSFSLMQWILKISYAVEVVDTVLFQYTTNARRYITCQNFPAKLKCAKQVVDMAFNELLRLTNRNLKTRRQGRCLTSNVIGILSCDCIQMTTAIDCCSGRMTQTSAVKSA